MFHMLNCINLNEGVSIEEFDQSLDTLSAHLQNFDLLDSAGLAESSGGRREQRTKDITNPMKIDEQAKVRIDDDWLHRASYAFDGVVFD